MARWKPFDKLTPSEKLRRLAEGEERRRAEQRRRFPTPFGSMQFKSMVDRRAVAVEQFEKLLFLVEQYTRTAKFKRHVKNPRWNGFAIDWRKIDRRFPIVVKVCQEYKKYLGRRAGQLEQLTFGDPDFKKGFDHRLVLFLLHPQDRGKITPEEFYKRLKHYKSVFVHEFTHYQDTMRFGAIFFGDREDHSYRSQRCELNAFYQEGAEKLIPVILRAAQGENLTSWEAPPGATSEHYRGRAWANQFMQKRAKEWLQKDRKKAWEKFKRFIVNFWDILFLAKVGSRPPLKAWFEKAARRDFEYAVKVVRKELAHPSPPKPRPELPVPVRRRRPRRPRRDRTESGWDGDD